MDEKYKYIDKVVKGKLDGLQAKSTLLGWAKLNKVMALKRFLKFSVTRFNIYYAAIVLTATTSGTYYAFSEVSSGNNKCGIKYMKTEDIERVEYYRDSVELEKDCSVSPVEKNADTIRGNQQKDSNNNILNQEVTNSKVNDSIKNEEPKKKVVRKVIKKHIVIKDTILQKDTVVVKKVFEQKGGQK